MVTYGIDPGTRRVHAVQESLGRVEITGIHKGGRELKTALVTGGSGFFGSILKRKLLDRGVRVVNIDLQKDEESDSGLTSVRGDIRNEALMERLYSENHFDAVFHCAAILAHATSDKNFLCNSNVDGTLVVAKGARKHGVSNVVFASSNCLWGKGYARPITEEEPPAPVEIYGHSKWEGEKILQGFAAD